MDGTNERDDPHARCIFSIWQNDPDGLPRHMTYLLEESGHITANLMFEIGQDLPRLPRIRRSLHAHHCIFIALQLGDRTFGLRAAD